VHGIVRRSGGHVRVASEVGKGTTFELFLPRIDQPAVVEERKADGRGRIRDHPRGRGGAALCEMSRRTLEEFGYRVLTASRASEAIARLDRHTAPLDLLLTRSR
jgi:hypothetical protein